MRLFRRRNDDANEPTSGSAPGASGDGTGSADDDVVRPERDPSGDWMTLPPVATATKPMATTFRVQTLPDILTSHHDTRLSGSLGHAVSADAPSGAVQGLASSVGTASPTVGHGELPLRERHHEHHEAHADPAPVVVHRLASDAPAPAPSAVVTETHLPPPAVSRSFVNPTPLSSSAPAPGAPPLPVMRVVDTAPAASTSSSSPTADAAAPSAAPWSDDASDDRPLVGDDRVGGFEVPLESLLGDDGPDDTPRSAAPPELAPPIQPRRVQRRADPAAAAPAAPAIRPTEPPSTSAAAADAPGAAVGLPDVPVSRLADGSSAPAAPLVGSSPLASTPSDSAPSAPAATPPASRDLPLRAPATSTPVSGSDAPADIEAPIQRLASADVPLVGESSLPTLGEDGPLSGGGEDDAPETVAPLDLPLAAPASAAGGAPAADDGAPVQRHLDAAAHEDTDAAPAPDESAPTLGTTGPLVQRQAISDTSGTATHAPSTSGSSLPLAPALDGGAPPPVQRSLPTADGPSASAVQRRAESAAPTATAGAPLVQRLASPSSSAPTSAAAPATPAPPLVRPITSLATAPTVGVQRSADTGAVAALSTLGARPAAATTSAATATTADTTPAVLRRLPSSADATVASGAPATVQTLAAVQRLDGASPAPTTTSTASSAASASSRAAAPAPASLPLHTPAAAVPSAAAVVVKAGLAERGPTGELLYTSPPGGGPTSFEVQRLEDSAASSTASSYDAAVQRVFTTAQPSATAARASGPASGAHRAAAATSASGGGGESESTDPVAEAKARAEEAKKLYPYIRSALEADLRRQLEGKSRSGRFRP